MVLQSRRMGRAHLHWTWAHGVHSVIADIHTPIIRADFLRKHGLLVNMKHGRLVDTVTTLQTQGTISHIVSPSPYSTVIQNMTPYWPNFRL